MTFFEFDGPSLEEERYYRVALCFCFPILLVSGGVTILCGVERRHNQTVRGNEEVMKCLAYEADARP
jgi:hypothetical protein